VTAEPSPSDQEETMQPSGQFDPEIDALASELARHLRTRFASPAAWASVGGGVVSPATLASAVASRLSSQAQLSAFASPAAEPTRAAEEPPAAQQTEAQEPVSVEELASRVAEAVRRELEAFAQDVLKTESVDVSEVAPAVEGEEGEHSEARAEE
jgi:hypothetical protein